jgi:hypothetical protein
VVDCKQPFGGPEQVLRYLSRYTHRVAISDHRLVKVTDDHVTFTWKDYRDSSCIKPMTLSPVEFMRCFLLHVLPDGFQRIRHYGFLANSNRQAKLARIREPIRAAAQRRLVPATQGSNQSALPRLLATTSVSRTVLSVAARWRSSRLWKRLRCVLPGSKRHENQKRSRECGADRSAS